MIDGNTDGPSENKFRAHIPVFRVIYFRRYYSGDEIKENQIVGVCDAYGEGKHIQGFGSET